jgi:predicted DNA-binding transcriptional regulator YafY
VHPLAIVQRGQLLYLVCLFADFADVRYLAIHRIVKAEMLFDTTRKPRNFSLDAYLSSGAMGFCIGDEIQLEAIFSRQAGEHLYETPLHRKQTLEQLADGRLRLIATIPNTKELQWWLLGLGDGVEVIAPAALRQQIKDTIQRMTLAYR